MRYWGEEEDRLFASGSADDRGRLLLLIASGVAGRSQFSGCQIDHEDLVSEMVIPLWKACENFDPAKGRPFAYLSTIAINAGTRAAGKAATQRQRDEAAVAIFAANMRDLALAEARSTDDNEEDRDAEC